MPDIIKDYWSQIVIAAMMLIGYGRKSQQLKDLREEYDEHEKECKAAEWITLQQHDRMQAACRNEWKQEFKHITDTLAEIKQEIRDLRGTK